MSTLKITELHETLRAVTVGLAELTQVPPFIRESLVESLRAFLPEGMSAEQTGWTLQALTGSLVQLVQVATQIGGPDAADRLISMNLLGLIASAAEGFVTDADLPPWAG